MAKAEKMAKSKQEIAESDVADKEDLFKGNRSPFGANLPPSTKVKDLEK